MKKLMRKLVLSSFALGLAVITLSTTTFAWYTNNVDVTADGVVGTSSTSGNALLLISNDKENWSTSATVVKTNLGGGTNTTTALVPLEIQTFDNSTNVFEWKTWDSKNSVTTGEVLEGSDKMLSFTLYFKVQADKDHDLSMDVLHIINETAKTALPKKDILAGGNDYINTANSNTYYTVDILRTLMVAVEVNSFEDGGTTPTATNRYLYNPEGITTINTDTIGTTTGFDAHAYYNEIMDTDITVADGFQYEYEDVAIELTGNKSTGQITNGTPLGTIPMADLENPNNCYLEVTFHIFINGWDKACFDAVQGQEIKVDLSFSSKEHPTT